MLRNTDAILYFMSLFLKQNEPRTQLQTKIAADLADRLKQRQLEGKESTPTILDDQHQTSQSVWLWLIVAVLVVALVAWVLFLQPKTSLG